MNNKGRKISEALRVDLTGQRFGRWLVLAYARTRYEKSQWLCRCDCGAQKEVCGRSLRAGLSASCGCITKENPHARTHGKSKSSEASMWYSAKKRAKQSGLPFDMRLEDIKIPEFCPLLGIKLEISGKVHAPNSPSLDRFDSTKGYVRGNIWVISHRANTLKSNASVGELKMLADNMAGFSMSKAAGV